MIDHISDKIKDLLLSKREIHSGGCWLWTGAVTGNGYGTIQIDNEQLSVHVVAAKIWLPDYNDKLWMLHKCDVRRCFNPEHLFQGTNRDNQLDAVAKNRNNNTRKTHCPRGHPYDDTNTMRYKNRRCKICAKNNRKIYRIITGK